MLGIEAARSRVEGDGSEARPPTRPLDASRFATVVTSGGGLLVVKRRVSDSAAGAGAGAGAGRSESDAFAAAPANAALVADDPPFTVGVKTLSGKTLEFTVRASDTVRALCEAHQARTGVPAGQLKVVVRTAHGGKMLQHEKQLREYGIVAGGSTIMGIYTFTTLMSHASSGRDGKYGLLQFFSGPGAAAAAAAAAAAPLPLVQVLRARGRAVAEAEEGEQRRSRAWVGRECGGGV